MAAASARPASLRADHDTDQGADQGAGLGNGQHQSISEVSVLHSLPSVIPLIELERRAIMNALEYTKGDRAVAAHLLGIGRTTLYRKLKEYQLDS
jgi:transcriptional regulator of acetoin/glycerol metabolism